ncbi:MAG TPA: NAD(P)/FAD-dependent oxidoreductase [Bryobacteraceae bacterium]
MKALQKLLWGGVGAAAGYSAWYKLQERREIQSYAGLARNKTIVILGSGFGGMAVAEELARLLPDPGNGEIVLIDYKNYLLFTPMLTEAAGGELDTGHITSPVRRLPKRIRFVQGEVTGIDLASKTVTVKRGSDSVGASEELYRADHLVIALGSVSNFHHEESVAKYALQMKSLEDAGEVCRRVLACLESASLERDEAKRKEYLTFVVGGAGYTGVETMAAINDLARDGVRDHSNLQPEDVRAVLVDPADRLLPELTSDLAEYAARKLKERQVELLLKTSVTGAGEDYVELNGNQRLPSRTLIWAAGVEPNPLVKALDCPKGKHGGVETNNCCQVTKYNGVWALGDCAEVPRPDGKGAYAPTAQNATREGSLVGQNIARSLRGFPPKRFTYTPIGELALVGKRSGVARIYNKNFSGLLAWAMWRAVYLAKMPSMSQRIRIVGDWTLDWIFGREPIPISPGWASNAGAPSIETLPKPKRERSPGSGTRRTRKAESHPRSRPSQ